MLINLLRAVCLLVTGESNSKICRQIVQTACASRLEH